MKIKSQINSNQGDVYNIEKLDNLTKKTHQDLNLYLAQEDVTSKKSINSCNKEALILFLLEAIGFLIDFSDLFPSFELPWWLWIFGAICIFIYLVIKYGEVFSISSENKAQIISDGSVLLPCKNGFSKNRSDAPCIYPNCSGVITPINKPQDYEHKNKQVTT